MPDLQLIGLLFAALLLGALCTLVVQWIAAVQRLAAEVTRASKQFGDIAEKLQPTVRRVDSFTAAAESSEPDLKRLQGALSSFSESSVEMTENLARVSKWLGIAIPVLMAAVERFSTHDGKGDGGKGELQPPRDPPAPPTAAPPAVPMNGGFSRPEGPQ